MKDPLCGDRIDIAVSRLCLVPAVCCAGTLSPGLLAGLAHGGAEGGHLLGVEVGSGVVPHAVSGEYPLDVEVGDAVHAVGEDVPGVPGLFWGDVQFFAARVPVEVVAGEEPLVVDVEDHVSSCVAGSVDDFDSGVDRVVACDDVGGVGGGVFVFFVNPDSSPVALRPFVGVSDVVSVPEEDVFDAAEFVDVVGELARVGGRVGHEVPVWAGDQVGVDAECVAGVMSEGEYAGGQLVGERVGGRGWLGSVTDRFRWACD